MANMTKNDRQSKLRIFSIQITLSDYDWIQNQVNEGFFVNQTECMRYILHFYRDLKEIKEVITKCV